MTSSAGVLNLRYPLYLDVPMMISFLAAIEDGVSYEENVQRRAGGRRAVEAEASGGVGLPSFLGLLPLDLRGRLTGGSSTEESEELQLVKRHTEASLFNRLRSTLHELDSVQMLTEEDHGGGRIESGTIIEATGIVNRNALDELLSLADRLRPFLEQASSPQPQPSQGDQQSQRRGRGNQGSSNRSAQSISGSTPRTIQEPDFLTIMNWVSEDLAKSDMTDIVLQVPHPLFSHCILTISKDFGTGRTIDSLLGAEVTVLGKVSNVIEEGDPVSLLRRSVLGYMPREQRLGLFGSFDNNPLFSGLTSQLEVEPPLIQVIPLSIFV
jgi:hypothetical protein